MRFSNPDGRESFPRVSSLASLNSPSKHEVFFASQVINRAGLSPSPNAVWVSVVALAYSYEVPFHDLLRVDPQGDPGEAASVFPHVSPRDSRCVKAPMPAVGSWNWTRLVFVNASPFLARLPVRSPVPSFSQMGGNVITTSPTTDNL
jgi:hypothetical protein